MRDDQTIYIFPVIDDRPVRVIFEDEYPCPISYQLGFNHNCKYADQTIAEKEITFSCNNIGCEGCILEKVEK